MKKGNLFINFGAVIFVLGVFVFGDNIINNIDTADNASGKYTIEITDKNIDKKISKGVVVIDFWATWCRPCLVQGPIIDEVAKEFVGKAVIGKMDVDKNKISAGNYHIRSIPTIIIFKDGVVQERLRGLQNKQTLVKTINRYL